MAAYVVMEPPRASGADAGEQAQLVRDGFSLLAFIAPALWLLWYRLWLEAVLVILLAAAIAILGNVAGIASVLPALSLLVSAYVALEGSAMRLARLRRHDWLEAATIEANNRTEAEIRYYSGQQQQHKFAEPIAAPKVTHRSGPTGPALGLFEYPGN